MLKSLFIFTGGRPFYFGA